MLGCSVLLQIATALSVLLRPAGQRVISGGRGQVELDQLVL